MKTFDKKFWISLIPILCLILAAGFTPYLFTRQQLLDFNFTNSGPIGDTIGGILGPFIAIIAAILTYMAFWVQYKANLQLRNDIKIDRFETKFYEMVKLHRQNLKEIELDGMFGKKAFEAMFNELSYIYKVLEECLTKDTKTYNLHLSKPEYKEKEKLLDLAFNLFYTGKDYFNRDHSNYNFLYQYDGEFIKNSYRVFHNIQENKQYRKEHFPGLEPYAPAHKMFCGQSSNLGNYFRLLYQTVKHVEKAEGEKISENAKYNYVKILRAQLSNHEQLLLYYNSLSRIGRAWIDNKYIQKYKLIKNIPLSVANFGVTPQETFKHEIENCKSKGEFFFEMQ